MNIEAALKKIAKGDRIQLIDGLVQVVAEVKLMNEGEFYLGLRSTMSKEFRFYNTKGSLKNGTHRIIAVFPKENPIINKSKQKDIFKPLRTQKPIKEFKPLTFEKKR